MKEKSLDDYSKSKQNKDGLQYVCKKCQASIKQEYYKNNPDKRWHKKRPEESLSRSQAYKIRNWEKTMYLCAKNNAYKKGREFNIDLRDIVIPVYCPLLGIKLTRILNKGRVGSNPSLDRIDNSKGYIKGNVMVISDKANRIKMNLSMNELRLLSENIKKLYNDI